MGATKLDYVLQRLAFLSRFNPTLLGKHPAKGLDADPEANVYIVHNSSETGPIAKSPINVSGRFYHAIQVLDLNGSDSWKLQGTLSHVSEGWTDITGLTTLTANGRTEFTGIWRQIRAVKNSGSGTTTKIIFMSMR
jgi:hypothetical protein